MAHHTGEHPTGNEDEYFARQNAELIKQMRARLDAERLNEERHSHYMKCPKCGANLQEVLQGQVRIDVCPECQGAWFDAGEVELMRQASTHPITHVVTDLLKLLSRPK
jgi:uncharacterized protein